MNSPGILLFFGPVGQGGEGGAEHQIIQQENQGEAESGDPVLAHSYESRFLHIMTEFQSRLGVSLDIVVGELGRFFTAPYAADVNRALHHLADTHDRIAIASSEGLTDRGDAVHFTAQSQREFGRRYFEAWKRVRDLDNRPVR